jgi:hypothetical protein
VENREDNEKKLRAKVQSWKYVSDQNREKAKK